MCPTSLLFVAELVVAEEVELVAADDDVALEDIFDIAILAPTKSLSCLLNYGVFMITTQHSQLSHVVYNALPAHVALALCVTLCRQLTSALFG